MIPTECPACGKVLNAPEKYAGMRVKCPKCKAPMDIPELVLEEITA